MSLEAKQSYRFGFLKSEAWRGARLIALAEHNGRCSVCRKMDWRNDVHHLIYRKGLTTNIRTDFSPLCRRCHNLVHIITEHRKLMGEENSKHGWRNTKRTARRILRIARLSGSEDAAILRAKAIFAELLEIKTNGAVSTPSEPSTPGGALRF